MITCSNCNKQLEDGTKFCDSCGTQIVETIFCQNCGKETSTEFAYCQNCGASLSEEAIVSNDGEKKKFILPKLPFKLSKKLIAIGCACIALILVITIVLSILISSGSNNYALYLKDGEMYFTSTSKIDPWQVTTRLIDIDGIDNDELVEAKDGIGIYTQLSDDGKIIFYIDKISKNAEGASLFYRYVNKTDKEPVKIDSDVVSYSISKSGKVVTYLKGDDGILFQHNLKEKTKIDSDVSAFAVSDDGKKIGYLDKDGGIYLKRAGKDKEKLDSEVTKISYINEDFDTVYYLKEDSLYKKVYNKDKEKLASEVSSVINVYESGEIYYIKSYSSEKSILDYVDDDMKEADASMTEPQQPEYPSYWEYNNYDDYQAAIARYEAEYEAYQEARQLWSDKQSRDELREDLSEEKITNTEYSLCYYNGKKETVLTDAIALNEYTSNYTTAEKKPVIIYTVYNQSTITKVKLSEIKFISEVSDMIDAALYSSSEKYISIKDKTSVIEQSAADRFEITPDGKKVYFFDDISMESNCGDLYEMVISGNKVDTPKMYDSDVWYSTTYLVDDNTMVYFKDVKDSKGEMYINKKQIDYDVNPKKFIVLDDEEIVYMVDWNDEKDFGTLKITKKGKTTKIADDVHDFDFTSDGGILYLYDYSANHHKGELFVYKNNKSEKIDDDVVAIIPIYNLKYRGETYNGK